MSRRRQHARAHILTSTSRCVLAFCFLSPAFYFRQERIQFGAQMNLCTPQRPFQFLSLKHKCTIFWGAAKHAVLSRSPSPNCLKNFPSPGKGGEPLAWKKVDYSQSLEEEKVLAIQSVKIGRRASARCCWQLWPLSPGKCRKWDGRRSLHLYSIHIQQTKEENWQRVCRIDWEMEAIFLRMMNILIPLYECSAHSPLFQHARTCWSRVSIMLEFLSSLAFHCVPQDDRGGRWSACLTSDHFPLCHYCRSKVQGTCITLEKIRPATAALTLSG